MNTHQRFQPTFKVTVSGISSRLAAADNVVRRSREQYSTDGLYMRRYIEAFYDEFDRAIEQARKEQADLALRRNLSIDLLGLC